MPSHRFPSCLRIGPHRYTVQITRRLRGYRVGTIDYRRRHIREFATLLTGAIGSARFDQET